MGYRSNVQALCESRHISNPIEEKDIKIKSLHFQGKNGLDVLIEATDMNRAGRLFIQDVVDHMQPPPRVVSCRPQIQRWAAAFFAERWMNPPGAMLRALQEADTVTITWKL